MAARRDFISFILAAVVAVVALSRLAPAQQIYDGPIIDAHGHVDGSFTVDSIVGIMDANGVRGMTLMARYYTGPNLWPGNDKLSLELAARYPGRFFPLVAMQRPIFNRNEIWLEPNDRAKRIFAAVDEKLGTGRFHGIGELIVKHFAYSSGRYAERDGPPYSALTRELSRLSAKFDLPLVLHMEGDPEFVRDFARLVGENPASRYVWAHNCGRSKAAVIRAMLRDHANLHCDLGAMVNLPHQMPGDGNLYGSGWPRMEVYNALLERDGALSPEMRALLEDFPSRFVVGMDVADGNVMNMDSYARRVDRFRRLLGQLRPETARKIAETNAIRIFRLDRRSASERPGSP